MITVQQHNQANEVASHMRHPLYELVANLAISVMPTSQFTTSEEQARRVGKIIGNCLAMIICVIPATIL